MTELWLLYTPVLFLIGVSILIILLLFVVSFFLSSATNTVDFEKLSTYECGFEPFGDARSFFDIHFYTIGLLFIIFDLEVVFLIPFVVDLENMTFFGYMNMLFFMLIILGGFYYEWAIGLLEWLPKKLNTDV